MSTEDEMHAERLKFIASEPVREAYRYLIDYASRLEGYDCYPDWGGSVIRSFRYAHNRSQPRSHHRYSFITNKKWVLFYFRLPSEVGQPNQLIAELNRMFTDVNRNTDGEITVRIKNIGDARRLMEFIFGQAGYEPNAASKVISSSGGKKNSLSKAAAAEKTLELLPDGAANEVAEFVPREGDERALIQQQIRERRGQQGFRNEVRKRYGDRCLVTGCKVLAVLEAAHIKPYQGEKDNHPENGLLLRADIHTLFDLDLLGIEPQSLRVELHPNLAESAAYKHLAGKTLRCSAKQRPSKDALKLRYQRFQAQLHQSP